MEPMIELPETYPGSDAERVDEILNNIYDLRGNTLRARATFEMYLTELTEYVTLIGYDILPIHSTKSHVLAIFYNEDVVNILGLQLVFDNDYSSRHLFLNKLEEYKSECLYDRRCLVYDIIEEKGEDVYMLNPDMSNVGMVIQESFSRGFRLVVNENWVKEHENERICHDCIHYEYDYTDDDYWETCKLTGKTITINDANNCGDYAE